MITPLNVQVYDKQQLVFAEEFAGPLELGRQLEKEEALFVPRQDVGRWRVAIAPIGEDTVSRKHALLEPLGNGRVRLTNLSTKMPILLAEGGELKPSAACELALPALLGIDRKSVRLQGTDSENRPLESLAEAPLVPGRVVPESTRFPVLGATTAGIAMEALVRWLQVTMSVLQSAASSSDFFQKAAQAVVDIVGLDSGQVLLWSDGVWRTEAYKTAAHAANKPSLLPSQQVLNRVRAEKRTFWQVPGAAALNSGSLFGVKVVVAAPILDRQGEVIGALYGDRRHDRPTTASPPITKIEAMLVDLLAGGVAAGLARVEQEQAALAARVQFEQFFTPELARELAAHRDLLEGRDCEVTLLFADIRGFSRISERLGPAGTVECVRDVMESLSDCVQAHKGVLVDYIGDELMAMWGAPQAQPDHARLACRAALDMVTNLAKLNTHWQPILDEPLAAGIGVNTGIARVGNTGTQRKFKYGPLGNTVNLASRLQGATKYLKTKLLISGTTQKLLDAAFATRKLCTAEVVNIVEAVDIYELVPAGQPNWTALQLGYEKALEEFEKKNFRMAARILGNLLTQYPDDGPSLVLMARAVNCLVDCPAGFTPVWKLPGK